MSQDSVSDDLETKIRWFEALGQVRIVKHKHFISLVKARWYDVDSCVYRK